MSFCLRGGVDLRAHLLSRVPIDVRCPTVRSEDPWRVAVTYAYKGDAVTLTFDDDLTVHGIDRETIRGDDGGAAP